MFRFRIVLVTLAGLLAPGLANATLSDFTNWTPVEDPAHPSFGYSAVAAAATLTAAGGPIPAGTDVGYQSVDGNTPATSTSGYAFATTADFSLAIDFDLSFSNTPTGQLAIGFGIGEDSDGMNSAGALLLANNGVIIPAVAGGARVGDVDYMTPLPIGLHFSSTGSFFASFEAATGNVTLGNGAAGAAVPAFTNTFAGIQDLWDPAMLDDKLLLASFFLRSDDVGAPEWTSGNAEAVFSNFRVLAGSAVSLAPTNPPTVTAAPEPSAAVLALIAALGLLVRRCR